MNDIISVIVPVYNVENYLRDCIESICNQTYVELDIVLVNDGSTDMCGRICDEYKEKDLRIQVIHKSNEGVAKAREAGIRKSVGKYLAFVDADDYIALDFCEKMMAKMKKYDVEWIAANFQEIRGEHYDAYKAIRENRIICDRQEHIENYINNYFYTFVIWGKIFKRELFENYQFQDLKIGEDTCCMIDVMIKTERSYLYNYTGYYYVSHDRAVTKSSEFNINEYDRWKAQRYIFDTASGQFPHFSRYLKGIELNRFVTVYQKTIVSNDKYLKEQLKKKLISTVRSIKAYDLLANNRMKVHIFCIKYLRVVYDGFLLARNKFAKEG